LVFLLLTYFLVLLPIVVIQLVSWSNGY